MLSRKSLKLQTDLIIPRPETESSIQKFSSENNSEFWYSARGEYSSTLVIDPILERPHSARNRTSIQLSRTKTKLSVIPDNKVYRGIKKDDYLGNIIEKLKDFKVDKKLKSKSKKKPKTSNKANLPLLSQSAKFAPVQSLLIQSLDTPSLRNSQDTPHLIQERTSLGAEPRSIIQFPRVSNRKELKVKKKKIVFTSPQPYPEERVTKYKKPFTPLNFPRNTGKPQSPGLFTFNGKSPLMINSLTSYNGL